VRKAPNWRGSVRRVILRDGIVTVGRSFLRIYGVKISGREVAPRRWRRPDGKLERIVYPPRPTIAELMGSAA
jgi:hypothetical protein